MTSIPNTRISYLKNTTLSAERFLSIEQAAIITGVYRANEEMPVILKRAKALAESLDKISIAIDPAELIVGNRTKEIRAGVVFPEAGISWLSREIDELHLRPQDPFKVRDKDKEYFRKVIEPFWKGQTLEDNIYSEYGEQIKAIERVVKINQKDHAQGHICPDVREWLRYGPAGLLSQVREKIDGFPGEGRLFLESVAITLESACRFISRYEKLSIEMADNQTDEEGKSNLLSIAVVCHNISGNPPASFREALQSVWFLFVILQMESNASSFSPGRMDQYLYPWYDSDVRAGKITDDEALELIDSLFIKFNQIVYMRNSHSARYFAGFPTGFNVTLGGMNADGDDATNDLSYLFLKAQEHCRLPQPNLTARLHKGSPDRFHLECCRIIGLGTGMPQFANDESIIPALRNTGIDNDDALNYALVGCVELSSSGNYLGWSDAAMFNLVKVLELTINDGICMISGERIGLRTGFLYDYKDYEAFEAGYSKQIEFFVDKMIKACEKVESCHMRILPSPFLSSVTGDCLGKGKDVTAGGAKYNYSGIQAIQVANIADSLAVLKTLVFGNEGNDRMGFYRSLIHNFEGSETLRQLCINRIPKYGNDVIWVDETGASWIGFFHDELKKYTNYRGGKYQMGLYTVSAHVPMGANVGATPDGRLSGSPLADGGLSPMYGRDREGPTAVLSSVSRIPSVLAANGTLLNMKFLPEFFRNEYDLLKFRSFIKGFIKLPIHHVQFNVISNSELLKAKADPASYRDLTIRVAGYTACFTELAGELQDEIISRTIYSG